MTTFSTEITFAQLSQCYLKGVENLIIDVCYELKLLPVESKLHMKEALKETCELLDIHHYQKTYQPPKGLFLLMLKNTDLLGTGAIKELSRDTCELKRMYFHQKSQGQGFGKKMLLKLIATAKEFGYKKMVLELYDPKKQPAAMALYKKFGFTPIKPYKESPAQVFLEKII